MRKIIPISIILATRLLIVKTAPTENADVKTTVESNTEVSWSTETLKEPSIVADIQNFTNEMIDYVISKSSDITPNEVEKVKDIVKEFLTNFGEDLRKSIERQQERDRKFKAYVNSNTTEANVEVTSQINEEDEEKRLNEDLDKLAALDGLSNAIFDEMNIKLRSEFPEMNEFTAREIVYRYRKNLYDMRVKFDKIIEDGKNKGVEVISQLYQQRIYNDNFVGPR